MVDEQMGNSLMELKLRQQAVPVECSPRPRRKARKLFIVSRSEKAPQKLSAKDREFDNLLRRAFLSTKSATNFKSRLQGRVKGEGQ